MVAETEDVRHCSPTQTAWLRGGGGGRTATMGREKPVSTQKKKKAERSHFFLGEN